MVSLKLLHRKQRRLHGGRSDGFQESISNCLLNRQAANIETVLSSSINDIFAGAVITRGRIATAIMSKQAAAAMATAGDPL